VSIAFARGVADKLRSQIRAWGIAPALVAKEIWSHLEDLDEFPGQRTRVHKGPLAGCYLHQFQIDLPPIILSVSIVYDVEEKHGGHVISVLDFAPKILQEE